MWYYAQCEKYSYLKFLWSECGKMRTRKTPNTHTFHAVIDISLNSMRLIAESILFSIKPEQACTWALCLITETHVRVHFKFKIFVGSLRFLKQMVISILSAILKWIWGGKNIEGRGRYTLSLVLVEYKGFCKGPYE